MTTYKEIVSIIMPMHNSEKFVREAIDSVLAQTYGQWELLVVDDNSTDNSPRIVAEYTQKDNRIKLLENDRHIGMPSAPRNKGLKMAQGRYVAFLDSDDVWFPTKLEQQVALFKDANTVIVFSNYEKMDEHGRRNNRIVNAPASTDYHKMLLGNVIGNLTGIFDRAKVGVAVIADVHHEDYVLWLSLLKKGGLARNTMTVTALYRVLSNSVSSNKFKVLSWQWNVYRDIEHFGILRSCYYFLNYAVRAYIKRRV